MKLKLCFSYSTIMHSLPGVTSTTKERLKSTRDSYGLLLISGILQSGDATKPGHINMPASQDSASLEPLLLQDPL